MIYPTGNSLHWFAMVPGSIGAKIQTDTNNNRSISRVLSMGLYVFHKSIMDIVLAPISLKLQWITSLSKNKQHIQCWAVLSSNKVSVYLTYTNLCVFVRTFVVGTIVYCTDWPQYITMCFCDFVQVCVCVHSHFCCLHYCTTSPNPYPFVLCCNPTWTFELVI